ncbi:hypothetical protein EDEG_01400 [Edhazardia aedis USNM 41457]|uniref:Uncharacterized protein n=1 Tax=Edhazardia aedis (strain USNM 41457) TaxID=1003232 RepID=J9D9Z2_EDHAE|nr:hypothetical protein EDEG_01400 [Edhazardia aedis USNM 41457]|eukprot:EJW04334.1 hypothetical protein EDEG_01400 [Edhazardia aedis USNM 41457]
MTSTGTNMMKKYKIKKIAIFFSLTWPLCGIITYLVVKLHNYNLKKSGSSLTVAIKRYTNNIPTFNIGRIETITDSNPVEPVEPVIPKPPSAENVKSIIVDYSQNPPHIFNSVYLEQNIEKYSKHQTVIITDFLDLPVKQRIDKFKPPKKDRNKLYVFPNFYYETVMS